MGPDLGGVDLLEEGLGAIAGLDRDLEQPVHVYVVREDGGGRQTDGGGPRHQETARQSLLQPQLSRERSVCQSSTHAWKNKKIFSTPISHQFNDSNQQNTGTVHNNFSLYTNKIFGESDNGLNGYKTNLSYP